MTAGSSALTVRAATPADDEQVLDLVRTSLGWSPSDPDEQLFRWKHRENPAGVSPAWIALDGDRVVGFRTFMRWEFLDDSNRVVRAVRAVDTATHPDYRGRGIFRTLTLAALEELKAEGVSFVFNTPNDQSRPGYLKMGWSVVGRLPVGVHLSGVRGLVRMAKSRVPADLWSLPTAVGLDAAEALRDRSTAEALLRHAPKHGLRTNRTPEYLAWRTALAPLHYRLILAEEGRGSGGIVFRLRRRGAAVETAVIEPLVSGDATFRRLLGGVLSQTGSDYAVGLRSSVTRGLVALPRQGPLLATRPLEGRTPSTPHWALALGDVELL
jgi:GNAT superfamily N-acetyltransferase